jgi:hypothetical protein
MMKFLAVLILAVVVGASLVLGQTVGTQRTLVVIPTTTDVEVKAGDSTNNAMRVNCVTGCGGAGGTSQADESAFTEGTTSFTPAGGVLNDTIVSDPAEDQAAAFRITAKRALHSNLRNVSGTEIASATAAPAGTELGLIVRNIPSGTQTISGTVTANAGTGNFSVVGTGSDNTANSTAKLPVIAAKANSADETWTSGNMAPLSVDAAGYLRTFEKNPCGESIFSQAIAAVPTTEAAPTAVTTCVVSGTFSNNDTVNRTVSFKDNNTTPLIIANAITILPNTTITIPFNSVLFTSGVRWVASGANVNGAFWGWQ